LPQLAAGGDLAGKAGYAERRMTNIIDESRWNVIRLLAAINERTPWPTVRRDGFPSRDAEVGDRLGAGDRPRGCRAAAGAG
jgi:hypothetical protein